MIEGTRERKARNEEARVCILNLLGKFSKDGDNINRLIILYEDKEGKGTTLSYNYDNVGDIVRHLNYAVLGYVAPKEMPLEHYNKYAKLSEKFLEDFLLIK